MRACEGRVPPPRVRDVYSPNPWRARAWVPVAVASLRISAGAPLFDRVWHYWSQSPCAVGSSDAPSLPASPAAIIGSQKARRQQHVAQLTRRSSSHRTAGRRDLSDGRQGCLGQRWRTCIVVSIPCTVLCMRSCWDSEQHVGSQSGCWLQFQTLHAV